MAGPVDHVAGRGVELAAVTRTGDDAVGDAGDGAALMRAGRREGAHLVTGTYEHHPLVGQHQAAAVGYVVDSREAARGWRPAPARTRWRPPPCPILGSVTAPGQQEARDAPTATTPDPRRTVRRLRAALMSAAPPTG